MRAVLLCYNASLAQVTLGSLRANGIRPLLVCNAATTKSTRASRLIDRVILSADFATCAPEAIRAINKEHAGSPIDLVIASDVHSALLLNEIRDQILPPIFDLPDADTLAMLNDKWRLHQLASRLGILVPKTIHIAGRETLDVSLIERNLSYPVVVKPTGSWAGLGVGVVKDEIALRAHVEASGYFLGDFIVQEFIAGDDVGASVFAQHGVITAECTFRCGPRDSADFIDIPPLLEVAHKLVAKTSYSGVANFDARFDTAGKVWLLECNPRFFMRMRAARFCGLDFLSLGLPGPNPLVPPRAKGSFYSHGDILSAAGLQRIFTGRWPLHQVGKAVWELARDPIPLLFRRLGYDAG